MDLLDASQFFDNDPLYDGYTGRSLGVGQTASFDDSSSDGATNRRRVLSTGPDFVPPVRSVLRMYGDRWLVGNGTPDGFSGVVVRKHFSMKRVTDALALLTPGQAVAAAAGIAVYVQKMYYKDTANAVTDSEYDTFWNVFIGPNEPVLQGTFFRDAAGTLYRVRKTYLPTEGLLVCQSDELDAGALQTCVFDTGSYDPVTETRSAGTTSVSGIQVDASQFYRYRHKSDPLIQAGDRMLFLPSTLAVTAGMTFTMLGASWRVQAVQAELDAKVAHVRLA